MARRKAVPAAPVVLTHPDSSKDVFQPVAFGIDPLEEYLRETDFFIKRQKVWSLFNRCIATMSIAASVADEIASQELYVIPTETNPSATTLLLAKDAVDVINKSMNRPGGVVDFVINFVTGYWASKTGAFIATPLSNGRIESITSIQPNLPRPYYGWMNGTPVIADQIGLMFGAAPLPVETLNTIEGIWYTDGSDASRIYFAIPKGQYWQACYGATAYGAWQTGTPKAESSLSEIVSHIAVSDYLRRTMLCTDDSQIVAWSNVDPAILKSRSEQIKAAQVRRKNGLPIDPKDEGVRMHVTSRDPDKPVQVSAINLRAFPEGFDPIKTLAFYTEQIALAFGVNAKRAAPDTQKERFGNATQAAMLNADEPGVRALKAVLLSFFNSVMLGGLPLRVEFMARNSAENYGLVQKDNVVSQTIAQLGDRITTEQAQSYMLRQGLLLPAEVGRPSIMANDGAAEKGNPMTGGGWASLRDRDNRMMTYEKASMLSIGPQPARTKAIDPEFELCVMQATARWEEWITNELPYVVDRTGISRRALEDEVDGITVEIFQDLVQCAKGNGARSADWRVRSIFDYLRGSFYNLLGSPQIKMMQTVRPANNMFDTMWQLAGKIAMGTATVAQIQTVAARYQRDIIRYFNSARAAVYAAKFGDDEVESRIRWVLGVTELHCDMCPGFAGEYASFADLWSKTGGLLPGDVRLTCSGNCKCHLEYI